MKILQGVHVMRIAMLQMNSILGRFEYNKNQIIEFCHKAKDLRCDLVVFPEMALFGYHPVDLLERQSVVEAQMVSLEELSFQIPDEIMVLVGAVTENKNSQGKPFYNSAVLMKKGEILNQFHKELLPSYDVFDETRHFESGRLVDNIFKMKDKKILVTICEDIWGWSTNKHKSSFYNNPLKAIKPGKVDLVINLSASPFVVDKFEQRLDVVQKTADYFNAPVVYVNMVGGQDELIFDGGSFACNSMGNQIAQSLFFEEDINIVDLNLMEGEQHDKNREEIEQIRASLVLGIRDFVRKTGFNHVHFGLSGGIDSAVVACLAVDALGPARVTGIGMPGPYNDPRSLTLSNELAKNLNINWKEVEITSDYQAIVSTLSKILDLSEMSLVHENIQARLRGLYLMAFSNKVQSLLLTTGNKSEYATGYATLYGDMCGGLAPIADLLKGQVYALARYYNKQHEIIPQWIIDRPPSAELRPDQKDEDSLPSYKELDRSVYRLVEEYKKPRGAVDQFVLNQLMKTEFKRWQAPPILKISQHAFGRGRRLPIAHGAQF